jgi:hypothetical protein
VWYHTLYGSGRVASYDGFGWKNYNWLVVELCLQVNIILLNLCKGGLMNGILKGKEKGVPTTVRFEIDQLDLAKEMRINVSEVCRQALKSEIKAIEQGWANATQNYKYSRKKPKTKRGHHEKHHRTGKRD